MRSRILKPGFFDNPVLGKLDPFARILFQGLWCYADREGRFKWEPERIKVKILPYDTSCDVPDLLESLRVSRLIVQYSVNGEEYGQVTKFKDHQRIHRRESPSKLPACENGEAKDSPRTGQGQAEASPRCPASTSTSVKTYTPKFEKLWGLYPRKIEKKLAYKKYKATISKGSDYKDLLKATQNYQKAMAGKEVEHIKHGATFFGPNEPWKEWIEGVPEGFGGVHKGPPPEDPHKDRRCKKCEVFINSPDFKLNEQGICERCETVPPS